MSLFKYVKGCSVSGTETPAEIVGDERRYLVLVIYDITDNKRRTRMVKCLEGYGLRVQKSAFEANLTRKIYEAMVEKASRLIDVKTDSLRIYMLSNRAFVRSWGKKTKHFEDSIII